MTTKRHLEHENDVPERGSGCSFGTTGFSEGKARSSKVVNRNESPQQRKQEMKNHFVK